MFDLTAVLFTCAGVKLYEKLMIKDEPGKNRRLISPWALLPPEML